MVTRKFWLYLSIFITIFTFAILTPALFQHINEPLDEDILQIVVAWIASGANLMIRLFKVKGWEHED